MNINIIGVFLIILFFILIFYFINKNNNKIISYQTIKQNYKSDFDLSNVNKKYKKYNCNDYCSNEICNNYDTDLNNFRKCIECQKKLKCYNIFTNSCEPCITFGIGQCKKPINPKYNLCA